MKYNTYLFIKYAPLKKSLLLKGFIDKFKNALLSNNIFVFLHLIMTKPVNKYIRLFSIQTMAQLFNLYFPNIFNAKLSSTFLIPC